MPHYSVMLALKFVTRVQKNARSTLNMAWSTADDALKRVGDVQRSAVQWQALMLEKESLLPSGRGFIQLFQWNL